MLRHAKRLTPLVRGNHGMSARREVPNEQAYDDFLIVDDENIEWPFRSVRRWT
jgi:hypothetical protein